jgi:hypothetical protein
VDGTIVMIIMMIIIISIIITIQIDSSLNKRFSYPSLSSIPFPSISILTYYRKRSKLVDLSPIRLHYSSLNEFTPLAVIASYAPATLLYALWVTNV